MGLLEISGDETADASAAAVEGTVVVVGASCFDTVVTMFESGEPVRSNEDWVGDRVGRLGLGGSRSWAAV
jgi:hypothetical protein